jgi:hypothetical protein
VYTCAVVVGGVLINAWFEGEEGELLRRISPVLAGLCENRIVVSMVTTSGIRFVSQGKNKKTLTHGALRSWIKVLLAMPIVPCPGVCAVLTGLGPVVSLTGSYSPLLVIVTIGWRFAKVNIYFVCTDTFVIPNMPRASKGDVKNDLTG